MRQQSSLARLLGSAAVAAGRSGSRSLRLALVGVALHGGVTMFVHVPANAILLSAWGPDRSDVLRKRWIRWHLIRVEMLAVGEAAALAALIRSRPSLSHSAGTR